MADDGNAVAAIAIGAGAGYALWYFFGDRILGRSDGTKPNDKATGAGAKAAPTPPPATSTRPCQIALDAKTLTAEGKPTDVIGAVAACHALGTSQAQVSVASDAPATTLGNLVYALGAAMITPTVIRK